MPNICITCLEGDGPLIDEVNSRLNLVASFRRQRFSLIYAKYKAEEGSLTADEGCFVTRCADDVMDRIEFHNGGGVDAVDP